MAAARANWAAWKKSLAATERCEAAKAKAVRAAWAKWKADAKARAAKAEEDVAAMGAEEREAMAAYEAAVRKSREAKARMDSNKAVRGVTYPAWCQALARENAAAARRWAAEKAAVEKWIADAKARVVWAAAAEARTAEAYEAAKRETLCDIENNRYDIIKLLNLSKKATDMRNIANKTAIEFVAYESSSKFKILENNV